MSGDSQAKLSANSDSGSRFRRFEASIHSASKDFLSKSAVLNPLANEWEAVKEARQMFQKEVEEDPLEGCPILYDPFFFSADCLGKRFRRFVCSVFHTFITYKFRT